MATQKAVIQIDTTEIDKATEKVENLLRLIDRVYMLAEKSWLIKFLLGIKNV